MMSNWMPSRPATGYPCSDLRLSAVLVKVDSAQPGIEARTWTSERVSEPRRGEFRERVSEREAQGIRASGQVIGDLSKDSR